VIVRWESREKGAYMAVCEVKVGPSMKAEMIEYQRIERKFKFRRP